MFIGVLLLCCSVASAQNVAPQYRKYFVKYTDKRSVAEKVFNKVGLTRADVGRSFALICGVSKYPNMKRKNRNLKPAAEDIRKLKAYLKRYEFFDEIVVLRDEQVTLANLEYFLQTYFPKRLKQFPKSRFLFAYTGHGMTVNNKGYLLKSTARSLDDKGHAIHVNVLKVYIDEVVAAGHQVLVLLNSCHSGTFLKRPYGDMVLLPKYPGAHAITAGGPSELAWHIKEVGSGSIFYEKLLAGISGIADAEKDGIVTGNELYSYLRREIQMVTNQGQNPQMGDISLHGSRGEFFFLNRNTPLVQQERVKIAGGTRMGGSVQNASYAQQKVDQRSAAAAFSQQDRRIGQYIDHGDGTVTDTKTGLMWKRCSEGLSGDNCEKGKAKIYQWNEAVRRFKNVKYAGYADWRLPSIDKLKTLVYCSKGKDKEGDCNDGSEEPTINQQAFPNTKQWFYWSGSPDANLSVGAWGVFFNYGGSYPGSRNFSSAVRLVRRKSGQDVEQGDFVFVPKKLQGKKKPPVLVQKEKRRRADFARRGDNGQIAWQRSERMQPIRPPAPRQGTPMTDPTTGMELVYIPKGCFQMGSPPDEEYRNDDEGPVHEVCVDGFWMGKYEVTQGQWKKIMGDNPAKFKKGDKYPVEQVSWEDAQKFIRKLNQQSGKKYRLPTEAEWEYAARAGTNTARFWGDSVYNAWLYANGPKKRPGFPWCCDDGYTETAPVGSFRANSFGLYDMLGNVEEWCADWYGKKYYASSPKNNPTGPSFGSYRVIRGESFFWLPSLSELKDVRSAVRRITPPDNHFNHLGFRLALPVQ